MQVVIIGAGLTGLTTAWYLQQQGIKPIILEARNRAGGRIHTVYTQGQASVEMGATWFADKHQHLVGLLQSLGLEYFEQQYSNLAIYDPGMGQPAQLFQVPTAEEASYRITGGTATLIECLLQALGPEHVHYNQAVKRLELHNSGVRVTAGNTVFEADVVLSTLPPNLLVNTVQFTPALPGNVVDVAQATHTWMGESIKAGLLYQQAFWQQANSSGTIFSQNGPVVEMYDHSTATNTHHALKGFVHEQYHAAGKAERERLMVQQLGRFYGQQATAHAGYIETDWRTEPYTYHTYVQGVVPHQNNGHQAMRQPLFNGRLLMGGSETATEFPGYMEGAVASAQHMAAQVSLLIQATDRTKF